MAQQGSTPQAFVPRGWSIEDRSEVDLDGDSLADVAQVLVQDEKEGVSERPRALVILLRRGQSLVRAGLSTKFLVCQGCGGVVGGTPALKLERGALVVTQYVGSRERSWSTLRFRWNQKRRCFELIGDDSGSADAVTGESTTRSCNLLTGDCVQTDTPRLVDDDGRELNPKPRTKTKRWNTGKRALPRLENVPNPFE